MGAKYHALQPVAILYSGYAQYLYERKRFFGNSNARDCSVGFRNSAKYLGNTQLQENKLNNDEL
jgi:hypothetical protein